MSDCAENIKILSEEIVSSLPFLLDARVNEAASVTIYNNMEDCLKMSSNVNDMRTISNAFQMCVTYAEEYNIDGLKNACNKWQQVAYEKLDFFKSMEKEEVSTFESVSKWLDNVESIVNSTNKMDSEELLSIKSMLDNLEDEVVSSDMKPSEVKTVMYRIAMIRESLRVSLVIMADLSSVSRSLKKCKKRKFMMF